MNEHFSCEALNSLIRSDEGLTVKALAFNLFTVANLPLVINSVGNSKILGSTPPPPQHHSSIKKEPPRLFATNCG